jgi:hypothetical protein
MALCHEDMWQSGGMGPPFLTSALDGDEQSASRPVRSLPGEIAPDTYWLGGWMVKLIHHPELHELNTSYELCSGIQAV